MRRRAASPLLVLGKLREGALGVLVPAHRCERPFPSTLHVLQCGLVRLVAGGHRLAEVLVLRLDHFISGVPTERELTWSAELLAGHCLHGFAPIAVLSVN